MLNDSLDLFYAAGKDKVIKYWDADKFEHLLTLEGHHSEVWCMALSAHGDFLVTGSHDRSLRRWERTDEPFFVEEEREKRLESLFEADIEVLLLTTFTKQNRVNLMYHQTFSKPHVVTLADASSAN